MTVDRENLIVNVFAGELAEYAFPKKTRVSPLEDQFIKVRDKITNANIENNLSLSLPVTLNDTTVRISCEVPYIIPSSHSVTVAVKRSVRKLPTVFNSSYNAEFLAEGIISTYVVAALRGLDFATVRLTFVSADSDAEVSFEALFSLETLKKLTETLISRAAPFLSVFLERNTVRLDEIKKLSFPYSDIRSGQHELMLGVMKTLRRGGKLVALAPTGTGKTMATLYPAIKALGSGFIDRIFYLTAKNETAKTALDAVGLLREKAPHLRIIHIKAKDNSCATKALSEGCYNCPRCNDIYKDNKFLPYKLRRNTALAELLQNETSFSEETLSAYAERYDLCPYELSLDLSEFCDAIVCDYNYVYDTKVRFRRYFTEDRGEKYAFLVDEAHNLPDRVRTTYTADFSPKVLDALRTYVNDTPDNTDSIRNAIKICDDTFTKLHEMCKENPSFFSDRKGNHSAGYYKSDKVPDYLTSSVSQLERACSEYLRNCDVTVEVVAEAFRSCKHFLTVVKTADTGFSFLAEQFDLSLKARYICLDPSDIISRYTGVSHATVMFSATLNPTEYFTDMLGCANTTVLKAESPFDKSNLSVTVFDGISTRLSDRRDTAEEIAYVISTVLEAREGNYFVFFPSYSYMKIVTKALLDISPQIKAVMQKPEMSAKDREKFLSVFKERKVKNVVGLCVLGGSFSEGVDLVGDGLIGSIIVGAGLPGISSELNLIAEYFENKYGSGHLYAYEYPAINRIEQAAGRVIRSANDRGVVVLVDDRLSDPATVKRFPEFWQPVSCTSDLHTLSILLDRFWQGNNR